MLKLLALVLLEIESTYTSPSFKTVILKSYFLCSSSSELSEIIDNSYIYFQNNASRQICFVTLTVTLQWITLGQRQSTNFMA